MMDISLLNQKDMKNCKLFASLFTKNVQNVHYLHGHIPGDASSLVNCGVDNVGQKSDHSLPCSTAKL